MPPTKSGLTDRPKVPAKSAQMKAQFRPATFRERGVAVPFTTPRLAQARVRLDSRDKLEALVPGFAEGRGTYVISWSGLPNVVTMTTHDLMLHEIVEEDGKVGPLDVRLATLKAQETGLAGPEVADAAKREIEIAEYEKLVSSFGLIGDAAHRFAGISDLRWNDFVSGDSKNRVREILQKVAEPLGKSATEIYDSLAGWGEIIAAIGLAGQQHRARGRRLVDGLGSLSEGLRNWAHGDRDEAAPLARIVAESADLTRSIAEDQMAAIDRFPEKMKPILLNWQQVQPEITHKVEQVHWMLDGWEFLQSMWRRAIKAKIEEQRAAIAEMYRVLPLVPVEAEPDVPDSLFSLPTDLSSSRFVRLLQDWRTGMLDVELIERLERLKVPE